MKSVYITHLGGFVRYFIRPGQGTPIVAIPGLITPAAPLFFDLIHHPLLKERTVLLYNYPGTGISDNSDTLSHHPREHAEILKQVLDTEDELLQDGIHIMGHSMGGTVGIYLAHMMKNQIHSLSMSEANLFPRGGVGTSKIASYAIQEWMDHGYQQMLNDWRDDRIGKGPELAGLQQVSDPVAIYRAAVQLVELDHDVMEILSTELRGIPTHFIYGEENVPLTLEDATPDTPQLELMAEIGVETHVVPDSGHMMMLDNLEGYATILSAILSDKG